MDHHLKDLYLCRGLSISPQPSLLRETQQKLDDYFCSQKHHAVISSCGILLAVRIASGSLRVLQRLLRPRKTFVLVPAGSRVRRAGDAARGCRSSPSHNPVGTTGQTKLTAGRKRTRCKFTSPENGILRKAAFRLITCHLKLPFPYANTPTLLTPETQKATDRPTSMQFLLPTNPTSFFSNDDPRIS